MADKNESIRPITWVIVGIAAILIVGAFVHQNFQKQKIESEQKNKEQRDLILEQQKALNETKKEIGAMTEAQKIAQKTMKEVQDSATEAQIKLRELDNKPSLSSVIAQWRPYVAYIECNFVDTAGVKYLTQSGSGIVIIFDSYDAISVFTNKHVYLDRNKYVPNYCSIKVPGDNNVFYAHHSDGVFRTSADERLDSAMIMIKNPDNYLQSLPSTKTPWCETKPSVGDSVVILGYPGIGSSNDITATEGIISGYDGDYYITSAKVEHGNSGGLAVLLKDNCYLGIPTYVDVGTIESLARILSVDALLR